ncbi:MAG: hypothetical protein QF567_01220, partial [Candidatus Pacearchaeota archaeon]|nr:hypothetical protein [Candidatus Pacearchaeota archaeon]
MFGWFFRKKEFEEIKSETKKGATENSEKSGKQTKGNLQTEEYGEEAKKFISNEIQVRNHIIFG